eukprot:CAMPEP_0113940464 /NCGR_PEP_ID=MMETSP1339-20121228/6587_1 /TAXON_ID=94617 /ORGANISM="Fibrocapsa japonica" /LENGTH=225 /DNA_ID=CAMNT_0000944305 /DNA_START=340 /DNA_END=1013 /DNA_ORIENTATION=- /assembly_acc=CAM_ASM_000762
MEELSLSKIDLGSIASCFTLFYGISKFLGGILSDFLPNHILFSSGLALAGLANVAFGLGVGGRCLWWQRLVWGVNGGVQGAGWPALSAIVLQRFPRTSRGKVFAVLTASGNLGLSLSPLLMVKAMDLFDQWEAAFYSVGVIALVTSVLAFLVLAPPKGPVDPLDKGGVEGVPPPGQSKASSSTTSPSSCSRSSRSSSMGSLDQSWSWAMVGPKDVQQQQQQQLGG